MPHFTEKLIILDSIESTNNYAMGLVKNGGASHGVSVFAIEQSEGKGRLGRRWVSEPGANIQLSVITRMEWASLTNPFILSMAASLSSANLVQEYLHDKVFVKWPNDIFINDNKAGGILIENVIQGTIWQWAITGIGININQMKFDAGIKATSLKLMTGKDFDVLQLARELQQLFLQRIDDWKNNRHDHWIDEYNSKLYMRDKTVKLQAGSRVFDSTIEGINPEGRLITRDTMEREWNFDEIKLRM